MERFKNFKKISKTCATIASVGNAEICLALLVQRVCFRGCCGVRGHDEKLNRSKQRKGHRWAYTTVRNSLHQNNSLLSITWSFSLLTTITVVSCGCCFLNNGIFCTGIRVRTVIMVHFNMCSVEFHARTARQRVSVQTFARPSGNNIHVRSCHEGSRTA